MLDICHTKTKITAKYPSYLNRAEAVEAKDASRSWIQCISLVVAMYQYHTIHWIHHNYSAHEYSEHDGE